MAHLMPNVLIQRLRRLNFEPVTPPSSSASTNSQQESGRNDGRGSDASLDRPTPVDVVIARILLVRAKRIPPDVVDVILDMAEYWASSVNEIDFATEGGEYAVARGRSQEDVLLLRSYPVGLTSINPRSEDAESTSETTEAERQYRNQKAPPLPLKEEQDARFFAKLACHPTPRVVSPVRKIVFTIKGKDQGWTSNSSGNGYDSSWSWYEAGLEKFDASETDQSEKQELPPLRLSALRPLNPSIAQLEDDSSSYEYDFPLQCSDTLGIQRNKTFIKNWQFHTVTWSYMDDIDPESDAAAALVDVGRGRATGDGSFVRDLRLGDVVTIWAKARFPGWVNTVAKVRIEVFWAV